MALYSDLGRVALGSRLRKMASQVTEDGAKIFELYGVEIEPKWFPVFFALSSNDAKNVCEIADEIGHTHPSVCKILGEMNRAGLTEERSDALDGRKTVVSLSKRGRSLVPLLNEQIADMKVALAEAFKSTELDLWNALEEFEEVLKERSLCERVRAVRAARLASGVQIVRYEPIHAEPFRALNLQWIEEFFRVEPRDIVVLDNPEKYIIDPGGEIFIALLEKAAVGVCALIKIPGDEPAYELAKMAVAPSGRGLGIGYKLGQAVVNEARNRGAKRLYIESNTKLVPAINLYRKLGFQEVFRGPSPYDRCNIQMELML